MESGVAALAAASMVGWAPALPYWLCSVEVSATLAVAVDVAWQD